MRCIKDHVGRMYCVKKTYLYTLFITLSKTFFHFLQFFESATKLLSNIIQFIFLFDRLIPT